MTNLKVLFYVVYSYKLFKYFGSIIIWKSINRLFLKDRVAFTQEHGL